MKTKTKIKKIMHILNPLAGKGLAKKVQKTLDSGNYSYMSKSPDDATEFIIKTCHLFPLVLISVLNGA